MIIPRKRELANSSLGSLTDYWSNGQGNDHLDQISRDKGDHTYGKCCRYCISGLHAKPCRAKYIADSGANDHSQKLDPAFPEVVNDDSGDDRHGTKGRQHRGGGNPQCADLSGGKDAGAGTAGLVRI